MHRRGVWVGAALFVILGGGQAQPSSAAADRFVIEGAVTMSKELAASGAKGIPITFDARFVIQVKVEKVLSGSSPWKAGSQQVFLIHSPARMFGTHIMKAKPFRFTFEQDPRRASERGCGYCLVKLEQINRAGNQQAVQQ